MEVEREELINEIKDQNRKLELIAKPFGGYINILEVDDIHFDNPNMPASVKQALAVQPFEEKLNQ